MRITRQWTLLLLLAFSVVISMTSCVYRPDTQQGNVITDADVRAIHQGMTADQIRFKLGDPILTNIFADNRMVYVYTFQHNHQKIQFKRLIIFLSNDRVTDYWFESQPVNAPVLIPRPESQSYQRAADLLPLRPQ